MGLSRVEGDAPLRVVYIAGAQHCGSTMLDAILGAAPGARSLGEVGGFHRYRRSERCDCDRAPATCETCRVVLDALDGANQLERLHTVSARPLKERRAYWVAVGGAGRRAYAEIADTIFEAAAAADGAHTLIDSSKSAGRAGALAHASRHDVRVVHLVRDGRSYLRSKRRRAAGEGRRVHAPLVLAIWLLKNLLLWQLLRPRLGPDRYLLCRYEDLVRDPRAELARIGEFAGLETSDLATRAMETGVERRHLFEPARRLDYRHVRLDPDRGRGDIQPGRHLVYWAGGGFVSRRWGYRRLEPPARPIEEFA